jgi:hypothetical protein
MRTPILLVAILAMAAAAPAPGRAAQPASDTDLRGIKGLRVTSSPVPPGAIDCNIDSAVLTHELEQQLAVGGMHPPKQGDDLATITVMSSAVGSGGLCSSAVMLGAYAKRSFFDDGVGWIRSGYVVIWQRGVMVSSPPSSQMDAVKQALSRLGAALLHDWEEQNAPPGSVTQ